MAARQLPIDDALRRRVEACAELELLDAWIARAAAAQSVEEVFEG